MKKSTFRGVAVFAGISGVVSYFHYFGFRLVSEGTRSSRMSGDYNSIGAALRMCRVNIGRFPTSSEGLDALVTKPASCSSIRWTKLMNQVPRDPWQNEYRYREVLGHAGNPPFEILSAGPDGVFYTDDDISSLRD